MPSSSIAIIGIVLIAIIIRSNPAIFARFTSGPQVSKLEIFYYVVGVASVVLGYYFNNEYVQEYAPSGGMHNFIWGPGSWSEFIALGYANPAAASASQDYTIMSLLIFPVFVVVDARRRGIKGSWLYCLLSSFFTSSAFPWAFYLATVERQRRHKLSAVQVASRA